MNRVAASLRTPWVAAAWSARWAAMIGVALICALEVIVYTLTAGRARAIACGGLWCGAIALWWLLLVPNALWLARDATALRLPQVRHAANAGVVLHAVASVMAPALLMTLAIGHLSVWLVVYTLAVTGCLLYLLLPAGLYFALWPALILLSRTHWLSLHGVAVSTVAQDAILPTLALVAFAIWRWLHLLQSESPRAFGLRAPSIWNFHRLANLGFTGMRGRNTDVLLARSARNGLAPVVDLQGVGPLNPVRSIRVALGRAGMPMTWGSWVRQWSYASALFAFFAVIFWLERGPNGEGHMLTTLLFNATHDGFGFATLLMPTLIAIVILGCAVPAASRWSGNPGELALLALLPGLGGARDVRASAVRACLTRTTVAVAATFVIQCALAAWAALPAAAVLVAALCCACALALAALCILDAVGGTQLPGWILVILTLALMALAGVATYSAFASGNGARWAALAGTLVIALALLLAACKRAREALRRRPHPFLANPS